MKKIQFLSSFTHPPTTTTTTTGNGVIVVQIVVSLIVIIYNLSEVVGNFKELRATVDMQAKSWDTLGNFPSFYHFNRILCIFPHPVYNANW
uniref:Uncharacterized protein n=1 Tax=Glossina pallidipes TaxID=7398 RepID=A0A1A9ZP09_GLOPL